MPVAVNTKEANEQHYEVPTEFYKLCLGKQLKYRLANQMQLLTCAHRGSKAGKLSPSASISVSP
jgi:hypothetical protein